jgi:hypothetical protein
LRLAATGHDRHALRWKPGNLAPDPRTLYLLREEAALWKQQGGFELVLKDC